MTKKQQGFTIVELMVAIVLGLIIVAAATQLFITGQTSLSIQKGMADLQESGNFGLRYITKDIRKTNYGNAGILNDRLANGGLVLTTRARPLKPAVAAAEADSTISVNVNLTNGATPPVGVSIPTTTHATGSSNVTLANTGAAASLTAQGSDQLVIQFYAQQAGIDCEGNSYEANRYVIERFFLRADAQSNLNEPNAALALACEAGSYLDENAHTILKNPTTSTAVFGSTNGEIIVRRVDHLHFLLGISNDANTENLRYISIDQYLSLNLNPRPRINSIQIGMLLRSNESVSANGLISENQTFNVLDHTVQVAKGTSPTYLRRVVTQTVALRNALISKDLAEM